MTCVVYTWCVRWWYVIQVHLIYSTASAKIIIVCVYNENNEYSYVPIFLWSKLFRSLNISRPWTKITTKYNTQLNTYFDLLSLVVMATHTFAFSSVYLSAHFIYQTGLYSNKSVVYFWITNKVLFIDFHLVSYQLNASILLKVLWEIRRVFSKWDYRKTNWYKA
jgi:hypothetical protein